MVRDKIFPVEVNGRGTISHIVAKQRILQIILYTATKYHLVSSLFSIFFRIVYLFPCFLGGYYFNLFNPFVVVGGLLSRKICYICLLFASSIGAQQILDMLMCTE